MKNRKGVLMMLIGLLLMLAALSLAFLNLQEEKNAGEYSGSVMGPLLEAMRRTPPPSLVNTNAPHTTPVPDAQETAAPDQNITAQPDGPAATVAATPAPTPRVVVTPFVPEYRRVPEMQMPEREIDGNYYIAALTVPALGLQLPIMSEWSYPSLKLAPCRYSGSIYQGNLILLGHNYVTHFGNLKELSLGAEVVLEDMAGNVFIYQVAEIETLRPTEVDRLVGSDYPLTIFTCTVGGQTRLTLRCSLVQERPAQP